MLRQTEMSDIAREVDGGEFTDIELVEHWLSADQEHKRYAAAKKRYAKTLADRLLSRGLEENDRGIIEIAVGQGETEQLVQVKMKQLRDYDLVKLAELNNCRITREQLFLVVKQVPSAKQLAELSAVAGESAKAVIEAAKRTVKTDIPVVKIRKPRRKKGGARSGNPFHH